MARIYAGILGPLAFLTSLARGAIDGESADATLLAAWCSLLLFSALGYLVGWVAGSTIEQSVTAAVSAELSASETKENVEAARPGSGKST